MTKMKIILTWMLILTIAKYVCAEEMKFTRQDVIILDPITLTASRAERKLSKVSSSVSVITEGEIEDSSAKSIPDLLEGLEGIYAYDASGVGTAGRINMRGFWGGMSTHQLILIDGIPQNKGKDKLVDWELIPLDNIERIEVVRGPVSALYGDSAMSGVINIITKSSSPTSKSAISGSYGNFETFDYKTSSSGAFGKTGYYFGAGRKSTEGFRRHSDHEISYINGKLSFLIDELQELKMSLGYSISERGAHPWALTEAQIAEDRRQARPGSENDNSEKQKLNLALTCRRDIDEASEVEGTFYYRTEDRESFYTSGSTGSSTKEQLDEEYVYGMLLRSNANLEFFGIKNSFVAGIDLEKNVVDYEEYNAPYQVRGSQRKDYNVDRRGVGPYLQDEIELFESLKLIAGLRFDNVRFDFIDHKNGGNSKDRKMSKVTSKCGLVYDYAENSNVYVNYAQAFRTPTIGYLFTYGSFSNPDLNPEEATSYEAGVRHCFNDRLKANAAFYWMDIENEIWYDSSASQYKNYGETSHRGIEARSDFRITEEISSFLNYSFIRAKNESGNNKDKYLTNVPRHKGSLGLKYEVKSGLKVSVTANRIGNSFIDSTNNNKLPAYTTVDTKISYEHKGKIVFFVIDNLFNKEYNSYGFTSGSTRKFSPAPRRTFYAGLKLNF